MNKDIFDQLPNNEQPVAAKLNDVSENMKVPLDFQWKLESQLMDAYQSKPQRASGWFSKLIMPVGWAVATVLGFLLLNWAIRSLALPDQVEVGAPNTEVSFEAQVRQGSICRGPLAVAHGFSVALTNEDKTTFNPLDENEAIGELRSFDWSAEDDHLAVLGNTTGNGNVYLADSTGALQPVLADSELGYLFDFAWSHDGRQVAMWSGQNNTKVYLVNADGSGLREIQLDVLILGTPEFSPDGQSLVFYGGDSSTAGLFELTLETSHIGLVSNLVEDETGYAWSPEGSALAYFEMDRDLGEARLVAEDAASGTKDLLATLPIPTGSGSSLPDAANLSWSQDRTKLVFEFGRNAQDRVVYLVNADGSGITKITESAHAPTMSADGKCLAFINGDQVFITDLTNLSGSTPPLLLVDLPTARVKADFRLDKLQWKP